MATLRMMPFFCDRWFQSRASHLPCLARGLYLDLLHVAWTQEASLPNDHAELKRAARVTDDEWAQAWPLVRRYFRTREADGRLVNDALLEIFNQAEVGWSRLSEQRRAAARARWDKQAKATLPPRSPLPVNVHRMPETAEEKFSREHNESLAAGDALAMREHKRKQKRPDSGSNAIRNRNRNRNSNGNRTAASAAARTKARARTRAPKNGKGGKR